MFRRRKSEEEKTPNFRDLKLGVKYKIKFKIYIGSGTIENTSERIYTLIETDAKMLYFYERMSPISKDSIISIEDVIEEEW